MMGILVRFRKTNLFGLRFKASFSVPAQVLTSSVLSVIARQLCAAAIAKPNKSKCFGFSSVKGLAA